MTRALEIIKTLGQLLVFAIKAVADGKPERVEKILPHELHSIVAKRLADAEAEDAIAAHYAGRAARRDEPTVPVPTATPIDDTGEGRPG